MSGKTRNSNSVVTVSGKDRVWKEFPRVKEIGVSVTPEAPGHALSVSMRVFLGSKQRWSRRVSQIVWTKSNHATGHEGTCKPLGLSFVRRGNKQETYYTTVFLLDKNEPWNVLSKWFKWVFNHFLGKSWRLARIRVQEMTQQTLRRCFSKLACRT